MNIVKIIYLAIIGALAITMVGSFLANDYFVKPKTSIRVKIDNHTFELSHLDTQKQTQILHALYKILTYDVDYIGEDDYYEQYSEALNLCGHYPVFLWWDALNVRTQEGEFITNISTYSWYEGGRRQLRTMKYVLDIVMHEGKGNITYQELLNTLESFYTTDDYRNLYIQAMIKERDHLRSLAS